MRPLPALLAVSLFCSPALAEGVAKGVCEAEMLAASARHGVPLGVLYAVALTETGRRGNLHPFALNIEGRSDFPRNGADAIGRFEAARRQGRVLIDIGCMQINHRYHRMRFASLAAMFEPRENVDYGARFLKELRGRHGTWTQAVARYHAGPGNHAAQKRYVCAVIRNAVAAGLGRNTAAAAEFCR